MGVQVLTDENFTSEIESGITLVDFWAEWCGPCRMIAPIVEELAQEIPQVKFAKLNVDENGTVSQNFGITAIPTLVLFKDGKPIDKIVGLMPKPQLKLKIEGHLS